MDSKKLIRYLVIFFLTVGFTVFSFLILSWAEVQKDVIAGVSILAAICGSAVFSMTTEDLIK